MAKKPSNYSNHGSRKVLDCEFRQRAGRRTAPKRRSAVGTAVSSTETCVSLRRFYECELKLTPEEFNSPAYYSDVEICSRYAQHIAAERNISVDDVDLGEEYELCNLPCQVEREMKEAFPNIVETNSLVEVEPNDGKLLEAIFH